MATSHPSDTLGGDFLDSNSINARRKRSGSLFSTNSIWNDDNISIQSQNLLESTISNNTIGTPSSFISPTLGAQPSSLNLNGVSNNPNVNDPDNNDYNANVHQMINRNRSYTTNATLPANGHGHMDLSMLDANGVNAQSGLSPQYMSTSAGNKNEINSLLGNLMSNIGGTSPGAARNRAQTFSGMVPLQSEGVHSQQYYNRLQQQQQHVQQQQHAQQQPQYQQVQFQYGQNYAQQPLLVDDFDMSSMVITNNFENPNLGPTNHLLFDNLPSFFDSAKLFSVLNDSFGNNNRHLNNILSIRTTTTSTSKLALVTCSSLEVAMNLKANFNHYEVVPGIILYIAFAKCHDPVPTSTGSSSSSSKSTSGQTTNSNNVNHSPDHEPVNEGVIVLENKKISRIDVSQVKDSLLHTIDQIIGDNHGSRVDKNKIISIINRTLSYTNSNYQDNFGPLPDPIPVRQFDAPKLRELRKDLEFNELLVLEGHTLPETNDKLKNHNIGDNRSMSQMDLEDLCLVMLDELPELCYDYIGNTVVQKLFLLVKSPLIKLMMVKEITPYLTQLSIHKNGTWAIQKIINLCHDDYQQQYIIGASLKPYTVKLFNDQFGNYALQGCIKFKSPFNDFLFESILDNFIEISFGRFGSRSIRTILETSDERYITKEQIVLISGLIIEYANELVVNNNGSLLITWFLDTFSGFGHRFEKKYELLTKKFVEHLDVLCRHKLANLTILKILNNRQDLRSKQIIMDKIFGKFDDTNGDETIKPPSKLLETILTEDSDPNNNAGPLFIYKILSNPLLLNLTNYSHNHDEKDMNKNSRYQKFIIQQIRRLLLELNINNYQAYKKLMDEVGLSNTRITRSSSLSKRGGGGSGGKRGGNNGTGSRRMNMGSAGPNQMSPHDANQVPSHHPGMNQYPGVNYMGSPGVMYQGGIVPPQGPPVSDPYAMGYPGQQSYPVMMTPQMMTNYQYPASASSSGYNDKTPPQPQSQQSQQQQQQDVAMMQQLEQLSLSSAALGYNSNPGTPGDTRAQQQNSFF
ncbi:hypothetical protein PSN45_001265 [Yamadazyma tenuis]|uniref:uncharacterized protein n=1 Tax=Candida tenuis TaxID=2315449 RepID=UPI00279FB48B|nr:hypothetical protein PSN45_001265 [Yamadazyma tenuis]